MVTDEFRFAIKPDGKLARVWREERTRDLSENISEHHTFRCGSIIVWGGISLVYRTDLQIHRRGSMTAVRYLDEVLDPIVELLLCVCLCLSVSF